MKRIICTLIILFLSYSSYNQNFISESKQWNVVLFSWGGISTEIFRISEDSIVNTLSYKKIWVSYDSLNSWVFQGLLLVSTFSSNMSDPVRIETYNLMPGLYILQCLSYGNKTVAAKFIVM